MQTHYPIFLHVRMSSFTLFFSTMIPDFFILLEPDSPMHYQSRIEDSIVKTLQNIVSHSLLHRWIQPMLRVSCRPCIIQVMNPMLNYGWSNPLDIGHDLAYDFPVQFHY